MAKNDLSACAIYKLAGVLSTPSAEDRASARAFLLALFHGQPTKARKVLAGRLARGVAKVIMYALLERLNLLGLEKLKAYIPTDPVDEHGRRFPCLKSRYTDLKALRDLVDLTASVMRAHPRTFTVSSTKMKAAAAATKARVREAKVREARVREAKARAAVDADIARANAAKDELSRQKQQLRKLRAALPLARAAGALDDVRRMQDRYTKVLRRVQRLQVAVYSPAGAIADIMNTNRGITA